jgi:glycerol-1-phosphate dehydrogenase [NAD(P)+]
LNGHCVLKRYYGDGIVATLQKFPDTRGPCDYSLTKPQMILPPKRPTLAEALAAAKDTRALEIGSKILQKTAEIFRQQFGDKPAVIVADTNTFEAAGRTVHDAFERKDQGLEPFIYTDPNLYGEYKFVEELQESLKSHDAIPVAVGSGTINDLTKLAAHEVGRPYMCVATAASMDGYTAFGASITQSGSKQTFFCPAPRAVVADLDIITAAPGDMNSWGYTDLVAKVTAGADWILSDAMGAEPVHTEAWKIIQPGLRELIADPAGVPARRPESISRLVEGLMLAGFAMQAATNSRAASGAEHQFSHLWDMQHHTHNGKAPSHGFKVGIGTLAITALYEYVLEQPIENLNVEACSDAWPDEVTLEKLIPQRFSEGDLTVVALQESRAKWVNRDELRDQLKKLRAMWPSLKERLRKQLLPFAELKSMLSDAGAPVEPQEIGISRERLREGFWLSYFLRRRITVLDVAVRTNLLEKALDHIFGPNGRWAAATHHSFS